MIMLDILTIVHGFADTRTASRIRRTCRRLGSLILQPIQYSKTDPHTEYIYLIDDKLHRLDGPAYGGTSGNKSWYRENIRHREYHPQAIYEECKEYRLGGEYHREVGPSILYRSAKSWYMRGKAHRKTGPACIYWQEEWHTLGKSHRLDGPAYLEVYAIRGVVHSISYIIYNKWIVNGAVIRK